MIFPVVSNLDVKVMLLNVDYVKKQCHLPVATTLVFNSKQWHAQYFVLWQLFCLRICLLYVSDDTDHGSHSHRSRKPKKSSKKTKKRHTD